MNREVAYSFDALKDLAKKSTQYSVGLPEQGEVIEYFSGIGFSISGLQFVAAMGEISELLPVPKFTIVPGVKNWVLGVSNIRGRLIPIVDLTRYFGLGTSKARARDKRILIVEQGDLTSGLLVDAVQGMQYFERDGFKTETQVRVPGPVLEFIEGAYQRPEGDWLVFDAKRLLTSEKFTSVSLTQS